MLLKTRHIALSRQLISVHIILLYGQYSLAQYDAGSNQWVDLSVTIDFHKRSKVKWWFQQ